MELIDEKELENVCAGQMVEYAIAYTARGAVMFGAFLAVCAIAKLPSGSKKTKKADEKPEQKQPQVQAKPSKIVCSTKVVTYYYK